MGRTPSGGGSGGAGKWRFLTQAWKSEMLYSN